MIVIIQSWKTRKGYQLSQVFFLCLIYIKCNIFDTFKSSQKTFKLTPLLFLSNVFFLVLIALQLYVHAAIQSIKTAQQKIKQKFHIYCPQFHKLKVLNRMENHFVKLVHKKDSFNNEPYLYHPFPKLSTFLSILTTGKTNSGFIQWTIKKKEVSGRDCRRMWLGAKVNPSFSRHYSFL